MKTVALTQLAGWQACQFESGDTSREFGRVMERGWYVAKQPDGTLFRDEHGVVTASSRRNLVAAIWIVFKRHQNRIEEQAEFTKMYEQRKALFDAQVAAGATEPVLRAQLATLEAHRDALEEAIRAVDKALAEQQALLRYVTEHIIEVRRGYRSLVFSVDNGAYEASEG